MFGEIYTNFCNYFKRFLYNCRNLNEQNNITLTLIIAKNPKKLIFENVQLFLNKFTEF